MMDQKIPIIATTIHKAKGLEYNSVILPYTDQKIDKLKSTSKADISIQNKQIGYRLKIREESSHKDSFAQNVYFQDKEEAEARKKEETRVLYVAMTRAIEYFAYFYYSKDSRSKKRQADQIDSWQDLLEGDVTGGD